MSSLVKAIQVEPLPIQILTAGTSVFSAVIDVSTMWNARIFYDAAFLAISSAATPPRLEVQVSEKDSGNDTWVVAQERIVARVNGGSPLAFTAGVTVGDFVFSTANPIWAVPRGPQYLFIRDTVFGSSEWNRLLSRAGSVNTMSDAFTTAHAITTTNAYRATRNTFAVDLFSVRRLRIAFQNTNTVDAKAPADCAIRVAMIATNSLS